MLVVRAAAIVRLCAAFGGAGPLHARDVAISLGIQEMIVPAAPGIVCAQGLIVSDLKEDFVVSRRFDLDEAGGEVLAASFTDLQIRAEKWFEEIKTPLSGRRLELSFDARYVGQNFELSVTIAKASYGIGIAV